MNPLKIAPHPAFPDAMKTMLAPEGMANCEDLVCRVVAIDRTGEKLGLLSEWQPTEADLRNLNAGMPVRLLITGLGMPPVAMWARGQSED